MPATMSDRMIAVCRARMSSGTQKALLFVIATHDGPNGLGCFLSNDEFAAESGFKSRAVSTNLKAMVAQGLIRQDGLRYRVPVYRVCWPAVLALNPGPAKLEERRSLVYFVQAAATGNIKIGVSRRPRQRMASLQVGRPDRLTLLCVKKGGYALEANLHERLSAHCVGGEWFAPHPDVLAAAMVEP